MGTDKRARQKAGRQARLEAMQAAQQREKRKKTGIRVALALAGFLVIAFVFAQFFGGGDDDDPIVTAGDETSVTTAAPTDATATATTPVTGASITGETPCPPADGSAERTTQFEQAPPMCIDPAKTYTAVVETTKGSFTIALDAAAAPQTVNNFVVLARYHYYDGVPFHRIIPGFVVQGGDAVGDPPGTGDPGYEFADELPEAGSYQLGSVAMANSGADTNGSQFFVVTGQQGVDLDPNYSLFGQVTEGFDTTVKALEAVGSPDGTPTEAVAIQSVTITES